MSFRSKQELLQQTAPRYQEATEPQKVPILNEFVSATGYARKYAIRVLNHPGFLEIDVVAHCGTLYGGSYLSTLTLTDVATGWTECVPLLHRGQALIIQTLDRARQLLPFPLLGLDTDNGGEFINAEVLAYCEREHITFTRGRTHKSNDQ